MSRVVSRLTRVQFDINTLWFGRHLQKWVHVWPNNKKQMWTQTFLTQFDTVELQLNNNKWIVVIKVIMTCLLNVYMFMSRHVHCFSDSPQVSARDRVFTKTRSIHRVFHHNTTRSVTWWWRGSTMLRCPHRTSDVCLDMVVVKALQRATFPLALLASIYKTKNPFSHFCINQAASGRGERRRRWLG